MSDLLIIKELYFLFIKINKQLFFLVRYLENLSNLDKIKSSAVQKMMMPDSKLYISLCHLLKN